MSTATANRTAHLQRGVLTIKVGGVASRYELRWLPSDFGQGYRLQKIEPKPAAPYDVLLNEAGHSCECLGHLRWAHCKHVASILALRRAGKL